MSKRIPAGHVGTVADTVGAVRYLMSPGAQYVTGTYNVIDGGFLDRPFDRTTLDAQRALNAQHSGDELLAAIDAAGTEHHSASINLRDELDLG